jgi:hypothetical protein
MKIFDGDEKLKETNLFLCGVQSSSLGGNLRNRVWGLQTSCATSCVEWMWMPCAKREKLPRTAVNTLRRPSLTTAQNAQKLHSNNNMSYCLFI